MRHLSGFRLSLYIHHYFFFVSGRTFTYYDITQQEYRAVMKAMVYESAGHIPVREIPVPEPAADEVLIKVAACGVCGTDVHIYKGEYIAEPPVVIGHEFSGTVEAAGADVTGYKPGDRVTVEPNIHCEKCYYCQIERRNQCLNWGAVGITRNGGFAEYVCAPEKVTFPIGDMPFEEAAFVEPLSCAVYGLKRAKVEPGAEVLILGAGPMGSILLQLAAHGNASKVAVVEPMENRRNTAEELGCRYIFKDTGDLEKNMKSVAPFGFDLVIDATGVPAVMESCFTFAKMGGTILFFGVCGKHERISISPFDIFNNDWTILGSFATCATFHQGIRLLREQKAKVTPLISHTLPLSDFSGVMKVMDGDAARMKIQIAPGM